MPIRGQEKLNLPRQVLTSRDGIYFSTIVLSMWDNIHGPKILMTWKGSETVHTEIPDKFSSEKGGKMGLLISTRLQNKNC